MKVRLSYSPQVNRMKFTKEEKETETTTTECHCMGLEKSHSRRKKKESQEGCRNELLELGRDILCFQKYMQATAEEKKERHGWVIKREVTWHSLQVKLQQKKFARLKKELREVESEMEVSYCKPEQGPLL